MSALDDILKHQGKSVIFKSRFRSYRLVLGKITVGVNKQGLPVTQNSAVAFDNFIKVIKSDEENAGLIEAMRKAAKETNDFEELDIAKYNKDESAKDAEIADLRARLAALEKSKAPDVAVRIKRGRPAKVED